MRKISFVQLCLSVLILFSTFACEKKDEVITSPQRTQQLTIEQQTMRNALETTTNVLLDMIKNNPDYRPRLADKNYCCSDVKWMVELHTSRLVVIMAVVSDRHMPVRIHTSKSGLKSLT